MKISDVASSVGVYTAARIERILKMPDSPRRAALAELRRGIGRAPGALPELWGEMFLDWGRYFPEDAMTNVRGGPTYNEWAIYTALTLFAMHQQGSDVSMHEKGTRIGMAVGRLARGQDDIDRVLRRFNPAATAVDMSEVSHHLRGLVQMLRGGSIPLDYEDLSSDLYRYQLSAESADNVRLKWGRDLYRELYNTNKNTEEAVSDE